VMKVTENTKKMFEALGCRPFVCHACAKMIEVGQILAWSDSYLVHEECKDKPITLPMDPVLRAEIDKELEAIGGFVAVLKGESGDWQSKTVTKGPVFSEEEVMAVLGRRECERRQAHGGA
jgi:hypothetical protein